MYLLKTLTNWKEAGGSDISVDGSIKVAIHLQWKYPADQILKVKWKQVN